MKKFFYMTALATMGGLAVHADESTAMNKAAIADNYAGRLGAGIIFGDPTGASLKYFFNEKVAVDGAFGWSFHDDTDFYMHSDVLWHNFDLIPVSRGRLPVYFGVGGLMRFRDDNKDNQVGVRVPVGLSYMFDNAPVDIFVEVAPTLDVAPNTHGEVTGGIGIRYWF